MRGWALLVLLFVQGCGALKPLKILVPLAAGATLEQRQQAYEELKVIVKAGPPVVPNLIPSLSSQSQNFIGSTHDDGRLEDYFRACGSDEAGDLAAKAKRRSWAGFGLIEGGGVLVGYGLYDAIAVKKNSEVVTNPYALGGIVLCTLGLWLQYDSATHYLLPGAESFNRFLRLQLGLGEDAQGRQRSGIQLSWNY